MRTFRLLFVVSGLLAVTAAAQPAAQPPPQPPKKAEPLPQGVPATAKELEPGLWRHVDEKGKAWLYKRSPFGVMRSEEPAPSAATDTPPKMEDAALSYMTVREDGDTLKFSRKGPFGTYSWDKKKANLNADEKAVWEREKLKQGKKE